ncbi:CvpA family protein [Cystobacter ferrugineus]|uniref:Colicin V production protein n=1 Tax=Cystobacter ferrugineus TaxID=83449 RepID=A0A1L9BCK5_9BACT|nr:CvpA family protein [Cystobacter ferrugineus]OJH39958.1 colicin V production protein [Cystobacter ferrugineus]
MTIDLILLGLVLLFAVAGAITGGARQIAGMVAIVVAWFVARKLGPYVGPRMAEALGGAPLLFGTLAGSLLLFIVVLVAVRYALTTLLRRMMGAKNPEQRSADNVVGFVLGGLKVVIIAYVMISALVFVDKYVVVAGRNLGVSPKDSVAFDLARRYNLFELTQFAAVRDMVVLAQVSSDPERARRLAEDPAYKALKKDSRFQKAMANKNLRAALERGDTQEVLRNNLVLQLLQDPQFVARLGAAARASQRD